MYLITTFFMTTKSTKYYDIIRNEAEKSAEILIYGVIGDSWFEESTTAAQFVREFKNLEKDHDVINIRLNSPGGSVFDGLAIYNAISNSDKEIHTYNDGVCASMASVILLSVPQDRVHPANNSLLMLHSPSTGAWGNKEALQNAMNVLDKVQTSLVTSICERTGLDQKEVEDNYFDYKDHWFTADEAKEEGFYQNIDERESEAIPENASTMKFSDLVKHFEPSNTMFSNWTNKVGIPFPKAKDNSKIIDMDIKLLRDAYGLDEEKYPKPEDVLNYAKKREQEFKDLETAKTKAENDLATEQQKVKDLEQEVKELKDEDGADPADVTPPVDPKANDPKDEAFKDDFLDTYSELKELTK